MSKSLENTLSKTVIETSLEISVKTLKWYRAALTHPSYRNEFQIRGLEDFDRLEFLGDAILNEVICKQIYTLFPEANEGALSKMRSTLVSRKILIKIARSLKIHKTILLGNGLRKSSADLLKAKILADVVEAIIAAIYFDRGKKAAENFILEHYENYFDKKKLLRIDPNPKSMLQEISLKLWKKLPVYDCSESQGKIKVTASVANRRQVTVIAASRREAEIIAAKKMIGKIKPLYSAMLKEKKTAKKKRPARKK